MKPQLVEVFQAWMRTRDELVQRCLSLGAEATMGAITMEQVSELMACSFAAGRLSLAKEMSTAATRELLAETSIPGQAN